MFDLWGVTIHLYGLILGLAVCAAMEVASRVKSGVDKTKLEKAMWFTILGGLLGARIYHVIDLWGEYYSFDPIKIIYLWEGGLAIWGAIAGGALALVLFCYFNKVRFIKYLDTMIVGIPLAQAIGRLGNWVNRELYGKNGEPLFAYEAILNLVLFAVLLWYSKKTNKEGFTSGVYLVGYGIIRTLLENLRPEENIWRLGGVPVAIWFSVLATLIGGYLIFRRRQS